MSVPQKESLRLTNDQVEQLATWLAPESIAEVVVTRMIGPQGEGLYAYSPETPDNVVFLDSLVTDTPRIYTVQQLYGRQISGVSLELASAAARILFDFQAAGCMGLVPARSSLPDVRKAIAKTPDSLFFHPWTNSDDNEERLIASNTHPNKCAQIRQVFTELEKARQEESLVAKNQLRAKFLRSSIAPSGTV